MERTVQKKIPYVTYLLAVINVIYFLFLTKTGALEDSRLLIQYGASIPPVDIQGEYYRLITACFIHGSIEHLANNMILLLFLGDNLEREFGHGKYLIMYLICCIGGNLVSNVWYLYIGEMVIAMGASGAVFGIVGAMAYILIVNRGRVKDLSFRRIAFFVILCFYGGLTTAGVDNAAHVGGFLTGILCAMVFYRRKKAEKMPEIDIWEQRE